MGKKWDVQSQFVRCGTKPLLVYLCVMVVLLVIGIGVGRAPATPSDDFAENVPDLSPRDIPRGSLADKTKYSRLGSQLQLDYANMCPNGSLMLDKNRSSFVPEHEDCPTLFIVGARKGGSTSLYTYVSEHPMFKGVLLDRGPQAGETFYFSHRWKAWKWSQYIQLFENTSDHMTGESSVAYLVSCHLPERLWRSCGNKTKFVILLRDPINRFESNFIMRLSKRKRSVNESLLSIIVTHELAKFVRVALKKGVDIESIENSWEKFLCLFSPAKNMIFEGFYYVHIMNWLCNFRPENILILNSEEFFSDTQAVFEEVIEFLGLPPLDSNTTASITSKAYNTRTQRPKLQQKMSETDRKKLKAVYETSNKPLLNLLGWEDLDWS